MSTVGAMSGTLATIFSLEKSRKWIIRDGLNGISRAGCGASMASGVKKALGLRKVGLLVVCAVNRIASRCRDALELALERGTRSRRVSPCKETRPDR